MPRMRDGGMDAFLFLRAIALSLLICLAADSAQTTLPGRASYRVTAGNSGGSATGIGDHFAITNNHVAGSVGQSVRIINNVTGAKATGWVLATDNSADLSLIYTRDELEWVTVNPNGIDDTKPIERFSWGGQTRLVRISCRLLHRNSLFHARDGRFATVSVRSESGDSGGGMFQDGQLVGVLWGTGGDTTIGAESPAIGRLASRYDAQNNTQVGCILGFCQPGRRPIIGGRSPRIPVRPEDLVPPATGGPDPAPQPGTPPAAVQPNIDIDVLVEKIIARLPKPQDGKDGADGEDGKPGRDGRDGLDGPTISEITEHLKPLISNAVINAVRQHGREGLSEDDVRSLIADEVAKHTEHLQLSIEQLSLTLAKLQEGMQVPTPTEPHTPANHMVLYASKEASYYSRLTDQYRKASEAFHPIVLAEPAQYTGELPALVAFQDRIPVAKWLGRREVEDVLHRIARGDADFVFAD